MKDAFERRALLLHLGEVLAAISSLLRNSDSRATVRTLAAASDSLAGLRLLTQVSQHMTPREFVQRAADAFHRWPQQLLELELDYEGLASPVQRHLFADNPAGWQAYVEDMKREAAWFGAGLPLVESHEDLNEDSTVAEPPAEPASEAVSSSDVEADHGRTAAERDSVEASERIYPAWPWKS